MTEIEFKTWLKHHFSRFTAASGWLAKFPSMPRHEGDPTQRAVVDAWQSILHDVRLEDAIRATDALASGDEAFSDRTGFDHHPRDVRRIARGKSSERIASVKTSSRLNRFDGEPTYRCKNCRDEGFRIVIHDQSISAARTITTDSKGNRITALHHPTLNPEGRYQLYSMLVACTCAAGERWSGLTNRRFRDTDCEWGLGAEENYLNALNGAERNRQAESDSYEWQPTEGGYDAYQDH